VIAARQAIQRPADAKLLVVAADGTMTHAARARFVEFVQRGDVIVANDASTLPASLSGIHDRTGAPIEVRLAGWGTDRIGDPARFVAVVFGSGDYRTRTEDRPPPPKVAIGDRLTLGPLHAVVVQVRVPPRLVLLAFEGSVASIWAGLARHGKPIQYAHVDAPLALWDVWTPIAGPPAAFEPPSAGFVLDWHLHSALRERGAHIATLTHAAGLSATGDDALDASLPLREPYSIPPRTARAVREARAGGHRVIAIGTTVVRALEHAAAHGGVRAGHGVADQRIGPSTPLRVVDALLTGTHERGTSHYQLLRAFASDRDLETASHALDAHGYRTHEFGDSMLVVAADTHRRVENRAVATLAA